MKTTFASTFFTACVLFLPDFGAAQQSPNTIPVVIPNGTLTSGSGSGGYDALDFSFAGHGWSATVEDTDFEQILAYYTAPNGYFYPTTGGDGGDNLFDTVTLHGVPYVGVGLPENGPVSQFYLTAAPFYVTHPGHYSEHFNISAQLFGGGMMVSNALFVPHVEVDNITGSGIVTYDFVNPRGTPGWYYVPSKITYSFAVPEPGTLPLLALGLIFLRFVRPGRFFSPISRWGGCRA